MDSFDEATGLRSMSRTTAFPATIMAGILADGTYRRPGVHAPESVGREPGLLDRMLTGLAERGVRCRSHVGEVRVPAPEALAAV
jgi:saccharopine dehydrogenase-like NADP-dependent oxidoreductase